MKVAAPAKINLYMHVLGRRPDRYHDVETVLQAVSLFDVLDFEPADSTAVSFEGLSGIPPEAPDLVERALESLGEEAPSVAVRVSKRIPLASGLGGGSSNAAAALLAADASAPGKFSRDSLHAAALRTGADVAFFLSGGCALGVGRGDELRPLECPVTLWWVLGISEVRISTAEVYSRFDLTAAPPAPALDEMVDALESGDVGRLGPLLHNDLESAAILLHPRVPSLRSAMSGVGALGAVMCGSGPTIAGLCRDESHAEVVAGSVSSEFDRVEVVSSLQHGARVVETF